MNTTKRIAIKKIKLHRAEGTVHEIDTREVTTWGAAEVVLRQWAHTGPEPGTGSHKCDVYLEYQDGEQFKLPYSLYQLLSGDFESMRDCVRTEFTFHAGTGKPRRMSEEVYREFLRQMKVNVQKWKMFADKYELGEAS